MSQTGDCVSPGLSDVASLLAPQALDNTLDNNSLADWLDWASSAPVGTRVDVGTLVPLLRAAVDSNPTAHAEPVAELPWTALLWTIPAETRLNVDEAAEAFGHARSWVYKRTSAKALKESGATPLPHRVLEGSLVFTAGELRTWIRETEESVHELPMESTPAELRLIGGGAK